MVKEKENLEESEETPTAEDIVQGEVKTISLGQVPTQYELVYVTPAGNLNQQEYLVWLGNMFLEFKAAIAGN